MSITPKPFSAADSLIKTVFRGAPNIFADVDLNRQLDLLEYVDEHLVSNVGGKWYTNSDNPLSIVANYDTAGALIITASALGVYYEHQGAQLVIDVALRDTNPGPWGSARVYLVARREALNFGTNDALCGIQTDVYPNLVAGADVVRWTDARFILGFELIVPPLGTDYELLACVAFIGLDFTLGANGYDLNKTARVYYESTHLGAVNQFSNERPEELSPVPSLWQALSALTRYVRRTGVEAKAFVNDALHTFSSVLTATSQNLERLITAQTHDRAFYDLFITLGIAPMVAPVSRTAQSLDNVMATHIVPVGARRNYFAHFTLSFTRISTVSEFDIIIYRGSNVNADMVAEGRIYPVTCLGGDGASMTVTVVAYLSDMGPGDRIAASLELRGGSTNQVRVTRASLSIDGLPV